MSASTRRAAATNRRRNSGTSFRELRGNRALQRTQINGQDTDELTRPDLDVTPITADSFTIRQDALQVAFDGFLWRC